MLSRCCGHPILANARRAQQGVVIDVALCLSIAAWYCLALNSAASATVDGPCRAAER